MKDKLDVVTLRGLSAVGKHGVHDFERAGSQVFLVDVELHVDASRASETDDIKDAVDYSVVAQDIVNVVEGPPVSLIETLANKVAQTILVHPLVRATRVTVHKPAAPVRHHFSDVSVTVHRQKKEHCYNVVLALGSNKGNILGNLTGAVEALKNTPGFEIKQVSPLVRTHPVLEANSPPQMDYYNAVVTGNTLMIPSRLLQTVKRIEKQFGRELGSHWSPRPLDIDIIQVDRMRVVNKDLTLPHPRVKERAFVLYPWSLLDPNATVDGQRVGDLLKKTPDLGGVVSVRTNWLGKTGRPELDQVEVQLVPRPPKVEKSTSTVKLSGDNRNNVTSYNERELPDWRSSVASPKTRIVDDVNCGSKQKGEQTQNSSAGTPHSGIVAAPRPRVHRYATMRPTPTGSVPVMSRLGSTR